MNSIDANIFFSDEQLQKAVAAVVPTDAKYGEHILVAAVNSDGVKVVATFKLREGWDFLAAAEHDWTGDNKVGAKLIMRW
jgi:hypothetical protein